MTKHDPLKPFDYLIGSWDMEYRIPKSSMSDEDSGWGKGTFKKALDDQFILFDYWSKMARNEGGAHGIFKWDEAEKFFRYWWFESSGAVMTATCRFINENILYFNWHNSLLSQTFTRINNDTMMLKMEQPGSNGEMELLLEVKFVRR